MEVQATDSELVRGTVPGATQLLPATPQTPPTISVSVPVFVVMPQIIVSVS